MLTDVKIRNAKARNQPYKIADSGGLYIEVRRSGAKLWRYRYRIGGKENVFALGTYPDIPLADARKLRDASRTLVKQAIHPAHTRQARRVEQITSNGNTFEAVAKEWVEQNKVKWSPYYLRQVEKVLERDAYPFIGNLPIKSINSAQLLKLIQRVAKRGAPSVALLLRQWLSAIFCFAVVTLRAESDPAAAIKGAVTRPPVRHNPPLERKDLPAFFQALGKNGGYRPTVIALRLMLLTFVRTIELRKAEWTDIDIENCEWRVPIPNAKMKRVHIVPLARQVVSLLTELKTLTGGQRLLFPNLRRPTDYITGTTLNRALERMGYAGKFSAHGFRTTASTILNEMHFDGDFVERQLAHKDHNKIRAIYNHAQYLPARIKMMQAWADFMDAMEAGETSVTPFKARVAA